MHGKISRVSIMASLSCQDTWAGATWQSLLNRLPGIHIDNSNVIGYRATQPKARIHRFRIGCTQITTSLVQM